MNFEDFLPTVGQELESECSNMGFPASKKFMAKSRFRADIPQLTFVADDVGPARYLIKVAQRWSGHVVCILGRNSSHLTLDPEWDIIPRDNLNTAIQEVTRKRSVILTGTSHGQPSESTDKRLIQLGIASGLPTLSVIETWNLLYERFSTHEGQLYPDHILLNDRRAKSLAMLAGLPRERLIVVGNPVFESLEVDLSSRSLESHDQRPSKNIVFISEEIQDSWISKVRGYNEHDCLRELLKVVPENWGVVVKLHPEEKGEKYSYIRRENFSTRKEMALNEIVQEAQKIVGMESTLLFELATAGTEVISFVPGLVGEGIFGDCPSVIGVTSNVELKAALEATRRPVARNLNWSGSSQRIVKLLEGLV